MVEEDGQMVSQGALKIRPEDYMTYNSNTGTCSHRITKNNFLTFMKLDTSVLYSNFMALDAGNKRIGMASISPDDSSSPIWIMMIVIFFVGLLVFVFFYYVH